MSFFSSNVTKPKTTPFSFDFTTAQIKRETLQEFGMYVINIIITNDDPTNVVTLRLEPGAPLITIPPNSVAEISDEIHSYIEVNPNAVTGTGNIRTSLTTMAELKRLNLIKDEVQNAS